MEDHAEYHAPKWHQANQLRAALVEIALAVLALLAVALSSVLQLAAPEQNWFMRSGAVMVFVGAVMEYRHNHHMHAIDIESVKWASGVGGSVIFLPNLLRKSVGYLAHVFVIVGTIIAAYGDLILPLLHKRPGL